MTRNERKKDRRLEIEIKKHADFCDIDPANFDKNDIKLISEYAHVSLKKVHIFLEQWRR